MNRITAIVAPSLALLAGACGADTEPSPFNGQFGEEDDGPCEEVSRTEVDGGLPVELASYDTELTVVPVDVMSDAAGTFERTLSWGEPPEIEGGEASDVAVDSVPVTVTLDVDPSATFALVEYAADEGIDVACPVLLETTATVTVLTADGVIDAAHTGTAVVGVDTVWLTFGVTDGPSTLDPADHVDDPEAIHPDFFRISAEFGAEVTGRVDAVDPSGDIEEDAPNLGRW
mgnify:CR=1 FL=1